MTVTEVAPEANTSPSRTPWNPENWGNCWRTITRHHAGRYSQTAVCCKRLDCEECGSELRQRAYEEAVARHAMEAEIWVVYVRAGEVDKLRKRAGREEQPIESVPVADDWNVVISPYHFEGAVQLPADEMRRIFLRDRISRRQHTRCGRWAPKKQGETDPQGETLSREYISPAAFAAVAKDVGAKIVTFGATTYFDDPVRDRPAHEVKRLLLSKEEELRRIRLRERGVKIRWSYSATQLS